MKNSYFILVVLFLSFTACKDKEATNENPNEAIDTVSTQQDTAQTDTLNYDADSTTAQADSSDAKSDVKLPNKMSSTTKVIPGEKGKFALAETKWKLVELSGTPIVPETRRDYFINFDSDSGKFVAFAGCSRFNGTFFMKAADKLGFSNIIGSKGSCDNIDTENSFIAVLKKTDNYMIVDNGKTLHLHSGKKAIAKFEAIR